MTDPRKIPDGVALPLPGARTTHRTANRDKVCMNVALPGCAGPVTLVEAQSCCAMICNAGDLQMLGIAIYEAGRPVALLHLFTCEEARMMAESRAAGKDGAA